MFADIQSVPAVQIGLASMGCVHFQKNPESCHCTESNGPEGCKVCIQAGIEAHPEATTEILLTALILKTTNAGSIVEIEKFVEEMELATVASGSVC